jgi:RNA polymerase sigma-70 factor (ECF subfamily)
VQERVFDEPFAALEEGLAVRTALARLPGPQQEILDRFFARDESYQTISAALDLPAGTIASRISRALAALRRELETDSG